MDTRNHCIYSHYHEVERMTDINDDGPIRCLVPHCSGKSMKFRFNAEYLCARHYQSSHIDLRREHKEASLLLRNTRGDDPAYMPRYDETIRAWRCVVASVLLGLDPLGDTQSTGSTRSSRQRGITHRTRRPRPNVNQTSAPICNGPSQIGTPTPADPISIRKMATINLNKSLMCHFDR